MMKLHRQKVLMNMRKNMKGRNNEMDEKKTLSYEEYQLQWLIDHGYSIDDLVGNLQHVWELLNAEKEENTIIDVTTAFEVWHDSFGFKESELWVCKDEWEQNEKELQEEQENELEDYER